MQYSQGNICVWVFFDKVGGLQVSKFIKKRLQRRCFSVINAKILRTAIWKISTAASENLSGAAILILRRYSGCSSLSVFYEIGVIKTSAKFLGKHIYRSLFSMKLQAFLAWLFLKLKTASWIFTAQKMKFSIKDFFSKRDQIRSLIS